MNKRMKQICMRIILAPFSIRTLVRVSRRYLGRDVFFTFTEKEPKPVSDTYSIAV